MKPKIKIFDYLWHIPHQYDMLYSLSNECEFSFGLSIKGQWDAGKRPLPNNLRFVTHYEKGAYDLAILHIDQQVVASNHIKTIIYNHFNNAITDIPKIVINHGSPVLSEWFRNNAYVGTPAELTQICRDSVSALVGDNIMVVNSHTASSPAEWGFGHPIVHGMNQHDWYDLPKEPRVFTAISAAGFDHYYNRECLAKVTDILFKKHGYTLNHAKVNTDTGQSPEAYKRFLGSSLLYFDPSFRTPMNRARTEAFLSGCCVIQVDGAHDLERWAKPGENIILVPDDPEVIASTIVDFIENRYQQAVMIGQKAKLMAQKEFSHERYRNDWLNLINQIHN